MGDNIRQQMIIRAFDPIIDLMQGVAFPLAFLMISAGFLLIMLDQRQRGLRMMKMAIIGYLGLQFAPALMGLVAEVAAAMRASTP